MSKILKKTTLSLTLVFLLILENTNVFADEIFNNYYNDEKNLILENDNTKEEYSYQNLLGVYKKPNEEKIIETLDDMNYTFNNINLKADSNLLSINTNINNEHLKFDIILYPSQIKNDNIKNKLIGIIKNSNTDNYEILKLTIEKNADESSLLIPNMKLYGKTVVSFAVYNKTSLEEYYVQFEIDNYDFDNIYSIAEDFLNDHNINTDELFDTEIAYFSLTPKEKFISTFNEIDKMEFKNSNTVSVYDNLIKNTNIIEDLEGKNINKLIEISKEQPISLSQSTYSLIPDIPDYLYKKQLNGSWTNGNTGYDSNGNIVGYIIYHMNDPYSGNVMNYVLRYYCTARINWNSNEFENSFNISHNIWVQYIKGNNSVYVFDDRAWNGRILVDAKINLAVNPKNDSKGYFVSRMTNANKNGSKISRISRIIIENAPYVSAGPGLWETFTTNSNSSTSNNSKIWFERNYTKKVFAEIDDIKYGENRRGYTPDYIGITVWGNNVSSISYGYEYITRIK